MARVGRYTYRGVTAEIHEVLLRRGRGSHKQAAAALGLTASQFSKRLRGRHERFKIEDIGLIADWCGAPPGWPFVPWRIAEAAFSRQ